MGRYRKYESTAERVRACRQRKRAAAAEAERERKQEECALRLQHEAEFERYWWLLNEAVHRATGLFDAQMEAMERALERDRGNLRELYCWIRRFPSG